jgi:hypothetical protein
MTTYVGDNFGYGRRFATFDAGRARDAERVLRFVVGYYGEGLDSGMRSLIRATTKEGKEIQLADYLLAVGKGADGGTLDRVLLQSGSAWSVGERSGRPGLVRRLTEGVQANTDAVIQASGKAGRTLARAWESAFGVSPNPSDAYRLAVRAVEHAAVPVVVPKQSAATLGHVIGQLKTDGDWGLPLTREDTDSPTAATVLGLCRALWKGHHDRHGDGDDSTPDDVSQQEAEVAVIMAVTLVQWFASGTVKRH